MFLDQGFEQGILPTTTLKAPTSPTPTPLPTVVPTHPVFYNQTAGDVGHRTLWVITVLMGIASLVFYYMAARVPVQKRLFHVLTSLITTIAFLSYFAMATGDGIGLHVWRRTETWQHIVTEIHRREIYWARYVDWALTTPLLLLDLSLFAGLNGASILVAIVADLVMVLTGLFAAFGNNDGQKWGYFAIGCVAFLVIVWQLGYNGRLSLANKDKKSQRFFASIGGFTLVLWIIYPIVWGVAEGAHLVNVDTEIIIFAVLDILAKPVFGVWLLLTHDSLARSTLVLDGFWAHGAVTEGVIRVGAEED